MTYNSYPDVPTGVWIDRSDDGTYMFHGIFSDADSGATGAVQYTVTDDSNSGATVVTGSGSTVGSGQDSPYEVSGGLIQDAHPYHFSAKAFDGSDHSASTSSQVVYKDACPPETALLHDPTQPDIAFKVFDSGAAFQHAEVPIRLDEWGPPDNSTHPALFLVHGGGWYYGCRRNLASEAWTFAHTYGFDVFSVDYRLACDGSELDFSSDVLAMCRWPYQAADPVTSRADVAAQDVQDAIGYLKAHQSSFPEWDGSHIAALGTSAGGTVLLDAVADAVANESDNKPQVTTTWSAKMLFANLHTVPNDGFASEDSCDHAKGYVSDPYDPGRVEGCWKGVDHYMDWSNTQVSPFCGFDGTDGEVDPTHTDVPGDCTTDSQSWHDASPYDSWASANETDYGPVFIANGGGPFGEPYDYSHAETVSITEPIDFDSYLLTRPGWNSSNLGLCIVDTPKHGIQYEALPCENDPPGASVFSDTAAFITSQLPT